LQVLWDQYQQINVYDDHVEQDVEYLLDHREPDTEFVIVGVYIDQVKQGPESHVEKDIAPEESEEPVKTGSGLVFSYDFFVFHFALTNLQIVVGLVVYYR
jgi:hypothetical protein